MKKKALYTAITLTILSSLLFSCKKNDEQEIQKKAEFWAQIMEDETMWAFLRYDVIKTDSYTFKEGSMCVSPLPTNTVPFEDGGFGGISVLFYELNGHITLTNSVVTEPGKRIEIVDGELIVNTEIVSNGYYSRDTMYLENFPPYGTLKLVKKREVLNKK